MTFKRIVPDPPLDPERQKMLEELTAEAQEMGMYTFCPICENELVACVCMASEEQ